MARTEIDPQLPFIQVHRSAGAMAAQLAPLLNVTYQHARGGLDVFWEGLADRRVLARGLALPKPMVVLDDAECRQRLQLAFGMELPPKLAETVGILEALEDQKWRVRGMSRYLEAERTRLAKKRGTTPEAAGSDPGATPYVHRGGTPVPPTSYPGEERGERKEEIVKDVRTPTGPIVVTPPSTATDQWLAEDFWRWAQSRRQDANLVAEKFPQPVKLSGWYTNALQALSGDVDRLCEAFLSYGDDKYWQRQAPPLPFAGFMSQWERFVGVANAQD